MALSLLVFSGFAASLVVPALYRLSPRLARGVAIAVPAGLTVWLLSLSVHVYGGQGLAVLVSWVPSLGIRFALRLDGLSLLFCLLIAGIGTAVVAYAGGYLSGARQGRFYGYILAFMAAMLGVVLADDPFVLFVFWELTSITSFLLIGFDHEREAARTAALRALLTTGLGGLALLAGLVLLQTVTGPVTIGELAAQAQTIQSHPLYPAILVLVLLGAFAKSAQFPFHFWLPGAMEAPTPVSAYLHSATMVKAGVYLLARLLPALGGSPLWFALVTGGGAVTLLVGAVLTVRQSDMKAVLAYATVSALGALVMLVGIGTVSAAVALVTYVLAHALYKSSLFLVAGALDHETGTRDLDSLGGLARRMPLVAAAGGLAGLSMAGIPPLLGFLSKEALYEAAWEAPGWAAAILVVVAVVSHILLLTVAVRTGFLPFFGRRRVTPKEPHGTPVSLWLPGLVLASMGGLLIPALNLVDGRLLSPAASAMLGEPVTASLALWHGLTPVLGLSALTVALGGGLLLIWPMVVRGFEPIEALSAVGPARWYSAALAATDKVARAQTGALQSGYLRRYMLIVLSTAAGLVGYTTITRGWYVGPLLFQDVRFFEVAVVVVMLAAILGTVLARSGLAAVTSLGVVGYGVGLMYVWFGAPDLAMTQFMVETLLVILFVAILYRLPSFPSLSTRSEQIRDAVVALAAGCTMGVLALIASGVTLPTRVSDFHVQYSYALAHGRNIVNVILVDFRGLDTLGETTVLTAAALGVLSLFRLSLGRNGDQ